MPTPAELALDYNELRRYKKVTGALTGKKPVKPRVRKRLTKEKRAFEARIDSPSRITRPVTARKLAQESENAGNLAYGRPIRESEQMTANLPSWYDAWKADIERANAATNTAWQGAQGATSGMQQTLGAQDQARAGAIDASAAADAAKRGATVDPATTGLAARAQQSRNQSATDFMGLLGTLGAAQQSYGQSRYSNVEPQKIAALDREGKRRSDLLKERGDYVSDYITASRDKERTYGLERAAFGLDTYKAKSDADADRAAARDRDRGLDIQEGGLRERQRHNLVTESKPGKKGRPRRGLGSLTQGQENKIVSDISNVQSWVKRLRDSTGPDGKAVADSEIRRLLGTGGKVGEEKVPAFDKDFINAAYDLVVHGKLSRANIDALHAKGLHIPPKWLGKKAKKKKKK